MVAHFRLADESAAGRARQDGDVQPADMIGKEEVASFRPLRIDANICAANPRNPAEKARRPGRPPAAATEQVRDDADKQPRAEQG